MATPRLIAALDGGVDCVVCTLPEIPGESLATDLPPLLETWLPPRGGRRRALLVWDARRTTFDFAALAFCGTLYRAIEVAQRGRAVAHVVLTPDASPIAAFVAALSAVYEPSTPCYVAASLAAASRAVPQLAALLLPQDGAAEELDGGGGDAAAPQGLLFRRGRAATQRA